MTALLDFPVTSAPVLPVYGESALVPGTSLRLPLPPEAVRLAPGERCGDCAGTGVMFDGGNHGTGALLSCGCMGLFPASTPEPRPKERVIKTSGGILRPVPGGMPSDYYFEPDYR